ncbi:helix-turn-helix domain-containing protein [Bovifimicola ammoniilytica]|uniref:helix-turn-helix domain-containing protein n=1 Tax=Bovifimicola ammoniilytica TaxID=2981720 RepID=UPI00293EA816|nr:helix-turn-helix domain-containing protein [Bovifimicola ammoniilytica]
MIYYNITQTRRTLLCQYINTEDFKKEVVKAYMAGDKSIPQIAVEFNVAKSSISKWVNEYKEECLYTTRTTAESNEAKEIRRLNQLLNEKDKEIAFLKKAAAFFAKKID